jgi:hypothetical protein
MSQRELGWAFDSPGSDIWARETRGNGRLLYAIHLAQVHRITDFIIDMLIISPEKRNWHLLQISEEDFWLMKWDLGKPSP